MLFCNVAPERVINMKAYRVIFKGKGFCFAIGDYEIEGDTDSDFIPGKGYTKDEWLKMVTIRYAMSLTSYRKYIGTACDFEFVAIEIAACNRENGECLFCRELAMKHCVDKFALRRVTYVEYGGNICICIAHLPLS